MSGSAELARDPRAVVSALALLALVVAALLCNVYAHDVVHVDPLSANPGGSTVIDGRSVALLQPAKVGLGVEPLAPTWNPRHFFLGADENGRDVASRLLLGGRNSLMISVLAALLATVLGAVVGIVAGTFGGAVDWAFSRTMDVVWAFPVLLLAISLSAVLFNAGLDLGVTRIDSGSLALPIVIIGVVYTPYVARPIRGEVLTLREQDFVRAAIAMGASRRRILARELLPNVLPTLLVLLPLMVATAMLLESGLSFLGIGVQPPAPSWGSMIEDGSGLLRTRPWIAIAPGILIASTVLALNVLGDALRDAIDPRAEIRVRA